MMSETRRVAVIGAGASGLTAIKCCLDDGLVPVCFERTDSIGGLWCYRDKRLKGQTSVMKSTVTNSSKELMCYSDFPMPKHFANCMHNSQVGETGECEEFTKCLKLRSSNSYLLLQYPPLSGIASCDRFLSLIFR